MASPSAPPSRRPALAGPLATLTLATAVAAVAAGGAHASAVAHPARDRATPGASMTRQLPQDITVAVRGRTVSVHFGSLRRRAVRTATIRFTRSGASPVVRTTRAAGTLRLTAPRGAREVRVSVPRTQEWTPTSITRTIRR